MSVFELPFALYLIAFALVLIAAAVQSSIGLGFNIMAVPILALLDPDLTPIPTIVMGIPLSALVLRREKEHADLTGFGWLLAGRLPGSFIGAALLAAMSRRFLDGFIAIVVLLAVAVLALGFTVTHNRGTKFTVGLASGITGAASAIGGPPLALLYYRSPGAVLRSTLALIFFLGQFVHLLALAVAGATSARPFLLAFALTPAALVGFSISGRLTRRVEGRPLRVGVLTLSAVAGLVLLLRTLVGS